MSALHKSWLAEQADTIARQRERVLRDSAIAFANPSPEVTRAAQALRDKLVMKRRGRDLDNLNKDKK